MKLVKRSTFATWSKRLHGKDKKAERYKPFQDDTVNSPSIKGGTSRRLRRTTINDSNKKRNNNNGIKNEKDIVQPAFFDLREDKQQQDEGSHNITEKEEEEEREGVENTKVQFYPFSAIRDDFNFSEESPSKQLQQSKVTENGEEEEASNNKDVIRRDLASASLMLERMTKLVEETKAGGSSSCCSSSRSGSSNPIVEISDDELENIDSYNNNNELDEDEKIMYSFLVSEDSTDSFGQVARDVGIATAAAKEAAAAVVAPVNRDNSNTNNNDQLDKSVASMIRMNMIAAKKQEKEAQMIQTPASLHYHIVNNSSPTTPANLTTDNDQEAFKRIHDEVRRQSSSREKGFNNQQVFAEDNNISQQVQHPQNDDSTPSFFKEEELNEQFDQEELWQPQPSLNQEEEFLDSSTFQEDKHDQTQNITHPLVNHEEQSLLFGQEDALPDAVPQTQNKNNHMELQGSQMRGALRSSLRNETNEIFQNTLETNSLLSHRQDSMISSDDDDDDDDGDDTEESKTETTESDESVKIMQDEKMSFMNNKIHNTTELEKELSNSQVMILPETPEMGMTNGFNIEQSKDFVYDVGRIVDETKYDRSSINNNSEMKDGGLMRENGHNRLKPDVSDMQFPEISNSSLVPGDVSTSHIDQTIRTRELYDEGYKINPSPHGIFQGEMGEKSRRFSKPKITTWVKKKRSNNHEKHKGVQGKPATKQEVLQRQQAEGGLQNELQPEEFMCGDPGDENALTLRKMTLRNKEKKGMGRVKLRTNNKNPLSGIGEALSSARDKGMHQKLAAIASVEGIMDQNMSPNMNPKIAEKDDKLVKPGSNLNLEVPGMSDMIWWSSEKDAVEIIAVKSDQFAEAWNEQDVRDQNKENREGREDDERDDDRPINGFFSKRPLLRKDRKWMRKEKRKREKSARSRSRSRSLALSPSEMSSDDAELEQCACKEVIEEGPVRVMCNPLADDFEDETESQGCRDTLRYELVDMTKELIRVGPKAVIGWLE